MAKWKRPSTLHAAVVALVLAGVAVRVLILVSPLRYVDADEAVLGLMADDMLGGRFQAFFWGQHYGGMHEALLVALLMALRVPRFLAVKLVPLALAVVACVLVWRIGRRVVGEGGGEGAARLAAALVWVFPAGIVWMSTKERGFYGAGLVLGLAVLLLALRVEDGRRRWDALALGLVAGSAWYATPQSLYFLAPAGVWLGWRAVRDGRWREVRRLVPLAAAGLLLGALPWLVANVHSGWASLETPPGLPESSLPFRFKTFWVRGLPVASGFMHPFEKTWFGGAAGAAAFVVVMVALGAGTALLWWRRRPARMGIVLLVVAAYPVVFALFPTSFFMSDPRYVTFLPAAALVVVAWLLCRSPAAVSVGVAALLAVLGVRGVDAVISYEDAYHRWDIAPGDLDPLVDALRDEGVDRVFADYWIAHRIDFETDEEIVAAPLQDVRNVRYEETVRAEPVPVYVTFPETVYHLFVRDHLDREGIPYRYEEVGGYAVWFPERRVLPEEITREFREARLRDHVDLET